MHGAAPAIAVPLNMWGVSFEGAIATNVHVIDCLDEEPLLCSAKPTDCKEHQALINNNWFSMISIIVALIVALVGLVMCIFGTPSLSSRL